MKINGESLTEKNYAVAVIGRGKKNYELLLCSLPMGWNEACSSRGLLDFPRPPRKLLKDKDKYIKDPDTGSALFEIDDSDPEYLKKSRIVSNRYAAATLAEHLREDSTITFEAVKPDGESKEEWIAYGDALASEIYGPEGFTAEEVNILLGRAEGLASKVKFDEATEAFLRTRLPR